MTIEPPVTPWAQKLFSQSCLPVRRLSLVIGLMHNHLREYPTVETAPLRDSFGMCSALIGHRCINPASECPTWRIREQARTLPQSIRVDDSLDQTSFVDIVREYVGATR